MVEDSQQIKEAVYQHRFQVSQPQKYRVAYHLNVNSNNNNKNNNNSNNNYAPRCEIKDPCNYTPRCEIKDPRNYTPRCEIKDPRIYTPRCEIKDPLKEYKLIHSPEEGLDLKSECILVSAMVHLPQE